jgi:hypothetical protein
MSDSSLPKAEDVADEHLWKLTARTRLLAQRVQNEIIARGQKNIGEAKQRLEEVRSARQAEMNESRSARQAAIAETNHQVAQPRSQVQELFQAALSHLTKQGAASNEMPKSLASSSGHTLQNGTSIDKAVADLKRLVDEEILKTSKPEKGWQPDGGGAGCLLLIVAIGAGYAGIQLIGGFIGFVCGFCGFYFAIMLLLHLAPVSRLKSSFRNVHRDAQRILAMLDTFATARTAMAEDEFRSAEKRFEAEIASAEKRFETEIAEIDTAMREPIRHLQDEIATLWADSGFAGVEWTATDWGEWKPASSPAFAARFGKLEANTAGLAKHITSDLKFVVPAFAPFPEGLTLLCKASGAQKDRAAGAVQSLLARLLATIPPAKLRFTFIDPIALGSNVAAFMSLSDHEESLVTSRSWSEPQHIEQRLGELTEHMETVIQKYLRTDFKTIYDYNEAAKEVAEPYRFVVVFDFPVNFTDTAVRRLISIARNGARCGVYMLIVSDTGKPLPYGFSFDELQQSASVVTIQGGDSLRWDDPDFGSWRLQLDAAAPNETLSRIIGTVGALTKDAMRVEVPYDKLLSHAQLGDESWWKASTAKSIRVPLGPTGARKIQYLVLGEGVGHHALIVGRPGSGKSNLMHVIITTLALTYSPDEIRLYLIDFKKGVEFKGYADCKLPHAEAIAIESEREFGLSVIERLDVELKRRGDLFRGAGASNIAEYREKTGTQIPRVLLLVDEFQEFFTQDDHVARQTALILDRLVRQGRAFGIHIILGSQTLAGSYNLSRSTLDQMAVRIAMQCSEADSRLILADDNAAARLLSRPGEAIYNAASGLVEGNSLFQVARFSEEDAAERLQLVSRIAHDSGKPIPSPIVFEGNELAQLIDCKQLRDFLAAAEWPSKRSVDLWLGDPIAIRDPIVARISRQSGSHLLILSRDEAEGVGMCVASIMSILSQQAPGAVQIFIADFTLADSEWAERAEEIEQSFPHQIKVLSRQRDVAETVKTLAEEVRRRGEVPPDHSSIYLVLQGMHRIKILRGEDESFAYDDDDSKPSEHFAAILRDGPEVGVHVISWCDTYPNAGRVADRRMMTQFGLRAGGAMSADDSTSFFDDAAASRIDKPHRIIFFDEGRPGQLEKFRPYSMPSKEWLEEAGGALKKRATT